MRLPRYQLYRPSGVEWLGDLPERWEVDRLKWTISGTINGTWGEDPNGVDDLICVRVADFDRERFLVNDEPPTLRAIEETQRRGRMLRQGDLLIEKSGGGEKQLVGCVVYFNRDFPAVCSNFIARMPILPRHSARFWSYVHAALYAGRLNYPSVKQTTGIQNLDSAGYLNIRVGIPPEDEQFAIADFLDRETAKIDILVAKKRTLIERLKEKRSALISRAVSRGLPPDAALAAGLDPHPKLKPSGINWLGEVPQHWDIRRIATDSIKITNGFVGPTRDILVAEGVRYLQSLHIKDNRIVFARPYYVEQQWSDEHSKSTLKVDDVLIVQTGDIGQVAVVPEEFSGANCHALIIVSPRRDRLSGAYLAQFLNSSYGFDELKRIQTGALHPHLNCGLVRDVRFPSPPLHEQLAIVAFVCRRTAETDLLLAKIGSAVERLLEYRTALITAAVTGKVDVRRAVA